jgi:hypothetical protein
MKQLVPITVLFWLFAASLALHAQPYTIRGMVMSSGGQTPPGPVANATITSKPGNKVTRTDATGNFALTGLANGTYTLEVSADGYVTTMVTAIVKGGDQRLYVSLPQAERRGFMFRGTVTSQNANGTVHPLDGAHVSLSPGNYSTSSGPDGAFVLRGVPEGAYTMTISAPGHSNVVSIFELKGNRSMQVMLVCTDDARR